MTAKWNNFGDKEVQTANNTYPNGGVSCFADSFVVAKSLALRMKFSGKSPATSGSCKMLCGSLKYND